MIHLNDVTVQRGGYVLFRHLDLSLGSGEHWVIQGKNGSGKTTLLELIAGVLHPVAGTIRYSFAPEGNWDHFHSLRKQHVHYIPAHALQTFLRGTSGLFYQQRYYHMSGEPLPTVRDILGTDVSGVQGIDLHQNFDLHRLMAVEVTRLSNGQLKKVLILQQLIKNLPKFLLLDYPFEGLDAGSRADLSNFITRLGNEFGIQVIITDAGQQLPEIINRKLVLDAFTIVQQERWNVPRIPNTVSIPPATHTEPAGSSTPVVEMKQLTIQYGDKVIIKDLDWKIMRGERWALTGKNGSGKTTLFSLIYADHPMAYSQPVYLFGKRRGSGESIWDIKRRISYLGPEQQHFLDPLSLGLSARQYLLHRGAPHDRLEQLSDFFSAENVLDLRIRDLSSGQQQLLLLLNFFLSDKELLLLDEPFRFLDPETKARVNEYLHHHLAPHTTLVLITHDEEDVKQWTHHRLHLF
jgi:molybdate transport system ATP-binding protein